MLNGLRKVVHVEVFDFDSDTFAYAQDTHKNQFGYKYSVQYLDHGTVVKEKPMVNNVEKASFFYRKLGINLSQLRSLRRIVKEITKKKSIPFPEENGVTLVARGGSEVVYHGEHTEDFCQKVLGYKKR